MLYCYLPPIVCVLSFFATHLLLTPSIELEHTIIYLDNKLHSCPFEEHMMVHDKTMLFDNFYEYTLFSQLTKDISQYFEAIAPILNIFIHTFLISFLMTVVIIISTLLLKLTLIMY